MLTHFSTFSGIGGMDLAAEWAGFQTVGQVEMKDFPYRVLSKHWPDVPKWRMIQDVNRESVRGVGIEDITVLSGGFPCQPFSTAGLQQGKDDDRYLWPEMLRLIKDLRPRWVVGENVANIVNMALDDVQTDLEDQGYTTRAFLIPACSANAPHRRERIFIVAHDNSCRQSSISQLDSEQDQGARELSAGHDLNGRDQFAADINDMRCNDGTIEGERVQRKSSCFEAGTGDQLVTDPDSTGLQRYGYAGERAGELAIAQSAWKESWLKVAARLCGMDDGVSDRVDRLVALGNAVVPQQAYPIFKAIAEIEGL